MKRDVSILLVILILATFFLRLESFKKEHPLTYDEIVYSTLAAQISEDPSNYNTIGLYQDALKKNRRLPEYFKKPLFKHPPLFAYLIALNYKISGRTYYSSFKVSLFFGVLLIVLAYLLGGLLFDNKIGIYAAFLMAIEPVSLISSQKIWMETTLAFFMILALYLFLLAKKKYNPWIMIGSGLVAGLAALTKYPGILSTGIICFYAIIFERWLFKRKAFLFSLIVPFLMLIPWLAWNYNVYGSGFMAQSMASHHEITGFFENILLPLKQYWAFTAIIFMLIVLGITQRKKIMMNDNSSAKPRIFFVMFIFSFLCILMFILRSSMINTLKFGYMPEAGWRIGMFSREPWYFYFGRLIELSPFYIFSIAAVLLLVFDRKNFKGYFLLFFTSLIILGFYILWGNYQSRYVTAAVVPLIIFSARTQFYFFSKLNGLNNKWLKFSALFLLVSMTIYFAAKTLFVDYALAVPNNVCYF